MSVRFLFSAVLAAVLTVASAPAVPAGNLTTAAPADVGVSSQRLARFDALMERLVREEELHGAVTMMARHGKVFHHETFGMQDRESGTPMSRDTIFRIYSMTKPIVGTAMMMLYEEGKWDFDDPIHKFIPEFKDLKVFAGEKDNGELILEEPDHAPTMRELMSHSAGFTYGVFGNTPVDKLYSEKDVLAEDSNLDDMIDKLAGIPLLYQPGTRWHYSVSVDIQGYLVEKLSGQSLPEFLDERIFTPLGMDDTHFYVPEKKRDRFATNYIMDRETNRLRETNKGDFGAIDYSRPPSLPSGGYGLVSTADDYLRFAQMLLNGGELDGARLLAPPTVDLLRADHLPEGVNVRPGTGFGMDFGVVTDRAKAGTLSGNGTYYWAGAAGTWFWIDPEYDLVFIAMIQRMGAGAPTSPLDLQHLYSTALYGALVAPGK